MDPLTAFSLATGIVTFVDFGSKLVSAYLKIRQSEDGRHAALAGLEAQSRELSAKGTYARGKLKSLQELYPGQFESLNRLAEDCTRAEKQLQNLIDSLTVKPGQGLKALKSQAVVSFRSLLKQDEIESLQSLLKNIRERIMMEVIMCTSENITKTATTINALDRGVGNVQETLEEMRATIKKLQPDFRNISHGRLANMSEKERIASGLWTSIAVTDQVASLDVSCSCAEETSHSPGNNDDVYSRILEGLAFKDMMARESQIEDPFPETFQWLLGDECPDSDQPLGFKQWLESTANETPFWITGNPASGKSTLMKFICTNKDVQRHLHHWSGDLRLLTCNIYFWNPGSTKQKSQTGLLLTMLYQLLNQRPGLCQLVARRRYTYFQLAGTDAPDTPDWTIQELRDSITQAVSRIESSDRLAVFIDGLDEYEGDLRALIAFLKDLHSDQKIKLCISSRPWNVFKDAFRVYPSLQMERLTRPDIEKYVHGRMGTNYAMQELRALERNSVGKLESDIIDKADGVFLWVVLVVEKLITTAQDNNDLHIIWKEFNAMQPGLEELYASMRRRMDQSLLEGASKMYQLLFQWKRIVRYSISATEFWLAINCHDPAEPQHCITKDGGQRIIPALERRLAGHTGGMLQVRREGVLITSTKFSVDFLHRTVFDWLHDMWSEILSDGPTDYDPCLVLASTLVSRLNLPDQEETSLNMIQRAFYLGRDCNNTTRSRATLLRVITSLQDHQMKLFIKNGSLDTFSSLPLATFCSSTLCCYLAIRFSCAPYLQAILESTPHKKILEPPGISLHIIPTFLWGKQRREWLSSVIDAADETSGPDVTVDDLNRKLKTFEILLQVKFPPNRNLKKRVEKAIKMELEPEEYWRTLLAGLNGEGVSELTHVTA